MFAKTLISILSALTIVVGLVVFIRNGDYAIFTIGMIAYLLIAISGNLCTFYSRLKS
jgi:hypothetical protein